jgi:hypothetical protein
LLLLHTDDELWKQLVHSRRLIEESRRLLASAHSNSLTVWDQTSPEDTSGQYPRHHAPSDPS